MPQAARTGQQMSTRAIAGMPSSVSVEDRSFEMVIATEHPVRTFIRDPRVADPTVTDCYIEVDEVLLASGLDMSRAARMPLLEIDGRLAAAGEVWVDEHWWTPSGGGGFRLCWRDSRLPGQRAFVVAGRTF